MTAERNAISLEELTRRVTRSLAAAPGLDGIWITAETSDVRVSGGHCYMELLQKDPSGGTPLARTRAVIWASTYARIGARFAAATGSRLASDMKVMVRVSVSFHSVYGFSLVISDIDPDYTVGDLVRKRNEILARLTAEGVADLNRSLPWSSVPSRIAIISATGAAGYGDFMKHLLMNSLRVRFDTTLFTATLQGEHTSESVIAALDAIMARVDDFDCVAIIRGGGAVSDLASFDDYELAANVAQFPLPIIVGIGHERDVTVLDFVANTRVKTPTAAAELLIGRMSEALGKVVGIASEIQRAATDKISGQRVQLAYYQGLLPALARNILDRNRRLTDDAAARAIAEAARTAVNRRRDRLGALGEILEALSPEATLRRGYSITRVDGKAVTNADNLKPGTRIETTFSRGKTLTSITE
ncbi:MAG: exodeoxyribonuclease VII large subunit [Bacteroidales bacterium]|nr:exodeoxyribonuclease VII large subunit [Bacteroidales bacterium]